MGVIIHVEKRLSRGLLELISAPLLDKPLTAPIESADMKYAQQLKRFRQRRASIAAMLARGMSQVEVAKKLGISRQRVCQLAKSQAV